MGRIRVARPFLLSLWFSVPLVAADKQKEWTITPYLKGTAQEIREKLNSESLRLIKLRDQLQRNVHESRVEIEAERTATIRSLHESDAFKKVADDFKKATDELAKAREGDDAGAKIAASSRYNKLRHEIAVMEGEAVAHNIQMVRDAKICDADASHLVDVNASLQKQLEWRAHLVRRICEGAQIRWPLDEGVEGSIISAHVIESSKDRIVIESKIPEEVEPSNKEEGMQLVSVVMHNARIAVTGIDGSSFRRGDYVDLYRNIAITDSVSAGDHIEYSAKAVSSETDDLLAAVVPPPEIQKIVVTQGK